MILINDDVKAIREVCEEMARVTGNHRSPEEIEVDVVRVKIIINRLAEKRSEAINEHVDTAKEYAGEKLSEAGAAASAAAEAASGYASAKFDELSNSELAERAREKLSGFFGKR